MQAHIEQAKQWFSQPKNLYILAASLASVALLKLYFRGGVCRVTKDLTGKVAVITGGNEGIGKATVEELIKRNCTVIFGARDQAKSQKVIKQIQAKNKDANIFFYRLDLADNQSIRRFSERVSNQVEKIDFLVNNAGVMAIPTRQITRNGFEMQMGINHLGHFYLTYLLWDKLKSAEEPRIINVSALAHRGFSYPKINIKIDFDDFHYQNGYNPAEAYGRSKVANILFSKQLQRRMDEAGIRGYSYSLHPGVVRTDLMRHQDFALRALTALLKPLAFLIMKSPHEGAQTTLFTILEDPSRLNSGDYYSDCKPATISEFGRDMQNASKLWKKSQEELEIKFTL